MNNRIRELRKTLGLTQKDFGAKLGVTCVSVSLWERGESKIVHRTVKQFEDIFNVNPDWLLTGNGDMFKAGGVSSIYNNPLATDIIDIVQHLSPDNRERVKKYAAGLLDIQQQEKEIDKA